MDRSQLAGEIAALRRVAPELSLNSHLPPARGLTERLLGTLALLPDTPLVGPDQAALGIQAVRMTR